MKKRWGSRIYGFTVVEILVVIVVIGILAGISIVAYNSIQGRARTSAIKTDLSNVAKIMEVAQAENKGAFPSFLPSDIRPSEGVTLHMVSQRVVYESLDPVQSGVLFHTLCNELIAEGWGRGSSLSGQVGQYITECNVDNDDQIHINGWNSHHFSVPLGANTVSDYYESAIGLDPWWPDELEVSQAFADELSSRYTAQGGAFPVTSFWDDWASPGNGGVPSEPLPPGTMPHMYCVEATHESAPSTMWHVTADKAPTPGSCA